MGPWGRRVGTWWGRGDVPILVRLGPGWHWIITVAVSPLTECVPIGDRTCPIYGAGSVKWRTNTKLASVEISWDTTEQSICYGPYQNSGRINAARAALILTGGSGSINAARAVLILTGESVSIHTDRFTRAVLILPTFCPRTYHALARGISNTA